MVRWNFLIVCIVLLGAGCAAPGGFVYDHPAYTNERVIGERVIAIAPVIDRREGGLKIDQIYESDPLADIQEIIKEELISTGLFETVVTITTADNNTDADILLEPSILRLDWEVPDYEDILDKMRTFSFLTGGIGGAVYGSTTTDVFGESSLHVRVVIPATNDVLLEKKYDGRAEEQMAILKSDTSETKARMVGRSLKEAMTQMKDDLRIALETGTE